MLFRSSQTIVERGELSGTYHIANAGAVSWHDFAVRIFELAARYGVRAPEARAITTAEYPTAARRPANSELNTAKFERAFGITLRPWREALAEVVAELHPAAVEARAQELS